ncbi:CBS domain-containing protein [Streptomyces sp. S.PB5]|uniref:CBS domain-containing protein n=1 Tax=Streptomyces sp. S.PB5 TaxID=3020844 RepID=UPI0025B1562A|nr:CBS domain-containing protein [Streptomyces sp. S.PB5]MDN3028981.1 CBS domain-containing protein [Streptomyces sp. S.PB5]
MSSPPVIVPVMASAQEAASTMRELNVGSVCVIADDQLVGVVTDRDLAIRILARGRPAQVRIDTVMTTNPTAVDADADIMAAYRIMRDQQIRRVPVVSEGRLVGVVTFDDLFWLSTQGLSNLVGVIDRSRDLVAPFRVD